MASLNVHVHMQSNMEWKPISQLVGVLGIKLTEPAAGNGQVREIPAFGLAFTDPDGETHVYVLTEDGKKNLIGKLTGGLVVPAGN